MSCSEKKRERRRRDLLRMKAKARRVYPDKAAAEKWAEYLAVCSCALCGNPRRFWKGAAMSPRDRRRSSMGEDDFSDRPDRR